MDGGQNLIIKASFNPIEPGNYEKVVPLYLDNDTLKPYMEIKLLGLGSRPTLSFDRREVILPTVPLNTESVCVFRIINQGYENLTLRHQISQEFGPLDIKLDYLDGNQMGITKHRIRIEIRFTSKRALSFTTNLEILDDLDKVYSIPISGTADNCVFTNFGYI